MRKGLLTLSIVAALAGCASRSRPTSNAPIAARPAHALKLADWNFEFLAERDGAGCHPRSEKDYAAAKEAVDSLDADVFAFEEVENEAAAARVFDPGRYAIVMERRPGKPGGSCGRGNPGQEFIRQAVGFAIRKDIPFVRSEDLTALQIGNPNLRSGVEIVLRPKGGEPLRLLAVHLKSGCFQGEKGYACPEILQQMPVMKAWVQAATSEGTRFAILGDWNRRLALPGDVFWTTIGGGDPSGMLTLTDAGVTPHCDPRYHDFIDHVVFDRKAGRQFTNFSEKTFAPGADPSDHCPISVTLPW